MARKTTVDAGWRPRIKGGVRWYLLALAIPPALMNSMSYQTTQRRSAVQQGKNQKKKGKMSLVLVILLILFALSGINYLYRMFMYFIWFL